MIDDAETRRRTAAGDRERSAGHPRRPRASRDGDGRAAAAVEHLPRRHELRRTPRAPTGGDRDRRRRAQRAAQAMPGFAERCSVQPGLTGIAQIYAPRDVSRRQKFRFDRLYIRRQSLLLDLRLILLSFWITARGTWEAREQKVLTLRFRVQGAGFSRFKVPVLVQGSPGSANSKPGIHAESTWTALNQVSNPAPGTAPRTVRTSTLNPAPNRRNPAPEP